MNRLELEKSPYLRQHIDNPVNWYPWGEEAFSRARDENKLIFLSIGYSTCHWCHVMAHECFEDQDVAAILNADYLSIKVDREERPDIDQVYMDVCQRLTGSGGWPLTIVMTPQAEPFYAATYIPKHGRHGRPGLMDLLPWLTTKWQEEPELLVKAAGEVLVELQKRAAQPPGKGIDTSMHDQAERALKKGFDARFGGFGRAPKFPRPHDLAFLLQRYRLNHHKECLEVVEKTLQGMRCGGIYDHLGGGFHRYSTDAEWLVPHFEKMLYDQAGLVEVYLAAWQATGHPLYAQTAREVLEYLRRDMLSPLGGFYSAEDADSEGEEGIFYLWDKKEILPILGDQADAFCEVYNVRAQGNYHDEVSGRLTGKNILYLPIGSNPDQDRFVSARQKLFDNRCKRIRPHLDDKVIAAWNGMAISAFARAGRILGEVDYLKNACFAAEFILDQLLVGDHRLLRRYRDGEAGIPGFSEDYACVARGLLDLYDSDFDTRWLEHAIALAEALVNLFLDPHTGRLYDTPHDGEQLLIRPCSTFDGAVPAAGSIAVEVFARLYKLTGQHDWFAAAESLMQALSAEVNRYPAGYTHLLRASNWLLRPGREVVLVAGEQESDLESLLAAVAGYADEQLVVLLKSAANAEKLSHMAPFTAGMQAAEGLAAAYVCQDFTCHRPVTSPAELKELLSHDR